METKSMLTNDEEIYDTYQLDYQNIKLKEALLK